jgi:hypothetical protein
MVLDGWRWRVARRGSISGCLSRRHWPNSFPAWLRRASSSRWLRSGGGLILSVSGGRAASIISSDRGMARGSCYRNGQASSQTFIARQHGSDQKYCDRDGEDHPQICPLSPSANGEEHHQCRNQRDGQSEQRADESGGVDLRADSCDEFDRENYQEPEAAKAEQYKAQRDPRLPSDCSQRCSCAADKGQSFHGYGAAVAAPVLDPGVRLAFTVVPGSSSPRKYLGLSFEAALADFIPGMAS